MRFLFLSLIYLFSTHLSAQSISSSATLLDFGEVLETERDSLQVFIYNPLSKEVNIREIRFFDTYGKPAFSSPIQEASIPPNDSIALWVYVNPRHNILHNSEMLLLTDSHRGSLSIDLQAQGKYSLPYYLSTQNKSEEELKVALKATLAKGYKQFSYNQARDQMYMTIDNWRVNGRGASQNKTVGVYSGKVASPYSNRSQAQVNFQFDTEHIFPQGTFNQNLPMRSDLHHLSTTWRTANSTRSNLNFGNVTQASWSEGGSMKGNGVFEPRDEQKGVVSRAMFYFVVRYQNYEGHMTSAEEQVLRLWHKEFAPDQVEKKRNEDIAAFQNNRNPFVDYPQFLERITSIRNQAVEASRFDLILSENVIDYDTVYAQQEVIYNYVVINDGNQELNLSNFSLADSYLEFAENSGANRVLNPGEAHTLRIRLSAPANTQIASSLTFSSNDPDHTQVSIPIQAVSLGANPIEPELSSTIDLSIYPNPAGEYVHLSYGSTGTQELTVQPFSLIGQAIASPITVKPGMLKTLSTHSWGKGLHLLKIQRGSSAYFEKIMVQ